MKKIVVLLSVLLLTGCSASLDLHQKKKHQIIEDCKEQNGKAIIEYYSDGDIRTVSCIIDGDNDDSQ